MKKLRIGFSARGLNSHGSGVHEYIDSLISEMARQTAGKHDLFVYYNTSRFLGKIKTAHERLIPVKNRLLWDHLFLPMALLRDRLDLVIYPKGTISLWGPADTAAIMLDLGYYYPVLQAYKSIETLYMRHAMKYAARRSSLIFTISEFTRQDVIRILNVDPSQVCNIYGSASTRFERITEGSRLEEVRRKYNLSDPFIFYPTNLSPRKNFHRLLEAFERISNDIPHHIYFTGQYQWGTAELASDLDRLSPRVHRLNFVADEDMPAIYSLAQFAVYPSVFEGLGLPILEAFQCGTPLLVSNQTSIPEVAGNAALIVDAYNIESISEGLMRIASDAGLRKQLVSAGYERARLFTWEKSVKVLMDAVESRWQVEN